MRNRKWISLTLITIMLFSIIALPMQTVAKELKDEEGESIRNEAVSTQRLESEEDESSKSLNVNADGGELTKEIVEIPDKNLEKLLREVVGNYDKPLTVEELKTIETLDADSQNIKDLSGIENLINLKKIFLNHNDITDISQLVSLPKLEHVQLYEIHLDDYSVVDELKAKGVEVFYFYKYDEPRYFRFEIDKITDESLLLEFSTSYPVEHIDFIEIEVDGEIIAKIEADATSYLIEGLENNTEYSVFVYPILKDSSGRSGSGKTITTLRPLSEQIDMPDDKLRKSILLELSIYNREALFEEDLEKIEELRKIGVNIKNLTGLEYAKNMTSLTIEEGSISDISPLQGLSNLEELYLSDNQITDIKPLKGLNNLKILDLNRNKIKYIDSLTELKNITSINISRNPLDFNRSTTQATLDQLEERGVELDYSFGYSSSGTSAELMNGYTMSSDSIKLEWQVYEEDTIIDYYKLYIDHKLVAQLPKDVFSYVFKGLEPNTLYFTHIEAYSSSDKLLYREGFVSSTFYTDEQLFDVTIEVVDQYGQLITDSLNFRLSGLDEWNGGWANAFGFIDKNGQLLFRSIWIDDRLPKGNYNFSISGNELYDSYTEQDFKIIPGEENHIQIVVNRVGEHHDIIVENNQASIKDALVDKTKNDGSMIVNLKDSKLNISELVLTADQVALLKEKNATIEVNLPHAHLRIPGSILTGDTVISFDPVSNDKLPLGQNALSEIYQFTIKSGGQTISNFDEPIELSFKVSEASKNYDDLAVFYYNPVEKVWEYIGGEVQDGMLKASTNHFSVFTVFDRKLFSNGTQQGGDHSEEEGSNQEGNQNQSTDGNESNQEETKDSNGSDTSNSTHGETLPNTATSMFNYMLLSVLLLAIGIVLFGVNKFRQSKK
ncbi:leucine-rich repeat domain-containing protein [Paraliobacillus sp. JSM ZJ581]|uniref:leucine-rich repeat domain-containing protein n=1 Tax=Paraliobacillus sp. JSM ZJ581 TaxID=3342118 RepID=UPI0035A96DA9